MRRFTRASVAALFEWRESCRRCGISSPARSWLAPPLERWKATAGWPSALHSCEASSGCEVCCGAAC
eukprot:3241558-Prymnesium_polylepis.1